MSFTLFSPFFVAYLFSRKKKNMDQSDKTSPAGPGALYDHAAYAPEAVRVGMPQPEARIPEPGLERRPSRELPEAVTFSQSEKHRRLHMSDDSGVYPDLSHYSHSRSNSVKPQHRRRRCVMWILIAVIISLVIAGAVVGGILGSQASRRNADNSDTDEDIGTSTGSNISMPSVIPYSNVSYAPVQLVTSNYSPIQSTGLAVTARNTSRWVYQQIGDGSIIEIPSTYMNAYQTANATVVTKKAGKGSPLAATSFAINGTQYRALAFTDTDGNVLLTNTTGKGWSTPTNVNSADTAISSSPALALCADTEVANGLRLFYASKSGNQIRELTFDFKLNATWQVGQLFSNSNAQSGVACTVSNGMHRAYYRGNHNTVQGVYRDWTKDNNKWRIGAASASGYEITGASDMAAATDDSGTDFIWYTTQDGTLTRGLFYANNKLFQSYLNYTKVPIASRFAGVFLGKGIQGNTLIISQPSGTATTWALAKSDATQRYNGIISS